MHYVILAMVLLYCYCSGVGKLELEVERNYW
jgi:hypothetical protein